jgi:putative selenium metabolism protein SsnA
MDIYLVGILQIMSLLIKNGYILTMNPQNQVLKNGAIYINDDKITEIGDGDELSKKYLDADEIVDAKGRVVMPGFICAHMHLYSTFATGMPLPPFPKGFINVLENLWWKIDRAILKDEIYHSALLGYIQAIRSGTTTVIDHHASPSFISGSLDLLEHAAQKLGVSTNLCYEVTNRNGDDQAEQGLRENERFIKKCTRTDNNLVSGLVGLHASFTLSDESLMRAKEIVQENDSGIHIHVAEGKADMEDAKKKHGMNVVQRLEKYELLNTKSLLAHCIHLDNVDYAILQKCKPNISHQPRSNMNNAVGTLNIWKLKDYQIPFGMGTDGMSADMKDEIQVGALIHKHERQDNTVGMSEIYKAQFQTNPQIVKNITGTTIGTLAPNQKADVIVTNYFPKSRINPENTMGHIFFGVLHESVSTTVIDGKIRMKEGKIPNIDESAISSKCEIIADQVWKRVTEM